MTMSKRPYESVKAPEEPANERHGTFLPFGCLVSLELLTDDRLKGRGLLIPEGTHDPSRTLLARIIACGPKCEQLKPGDIVLLDDIEKNDNVRRLFKVCHRNHAPVWIVREDTILGVEHPA